MFPKTWRLKKTRVNRENRRKSEQLLARTKSGIPADVRDVALKGASPPVTCTLSRDINGLRGDVELVADDFTAARFRSVVRKRLSKTGTVTVGEKVKRKLERRQDAVGRNVQRRQHYDGAATSAISTLRLLDGEKLAEVDRLIRLALARFNDGPKQNRNADQHHPEDGGLDIRIHTTSLPKKQNTLLQ